MNVRQWRARVYLIALRRRRAFFGLCVSIVLTACGGDSFTPGTPSGPTIPTIGGAYISSTLWRFNRTRTSDNSQLPAFTCAGNLTIRNQVGDTFSGTFLIQDESCGQLGGTVESGALSADGAVSFALTVTGASNSNLILAAFGCTYVSGDTRLTGSIRGTQLEASSTTLMDCPNDGRVSLTLRIAGSR